VPLPCSPVTQRRRPESGGALEINTVHHERQLAV
jgi:hypothetical protein